MPCEATIKAWRPAAGGPLRFGNEPRDGRAYSPINVPCGYCILCRQEMTRQAAIRITHEAQLWEESSFVSLTYNDKNLPQYGSLNYEDLQKFWKRLRHHVGTLRYYAVGEYGDESLRPHYHACIFGHAFTENRQIIRTTPSLLWTSKVLEDAWGLGNVAIGALNYQTAQYTASYTLKKLRAKQKYVRVDEETGELIHLTQPRAFMSRNLAREWWDFYGDYVANHDQVVINGSPQKPPKAYDRWLGEKDEERLANIKQQRKEDAPRLTEQESRARAENARARVRNKNKTL